MENTSRICAFCGKPIKNGFITITGRSFCFVEWLADPEKGRFRTKWKIRERIFSALSSSRRRALKCDKCRIIIFDLQDPSYLNIATSGPWKQ